MRGCPLEGTFAHECLVHRTEWLPGARPEYCRVPHLLTPWNIWRGAPEAALRFDPERGVKFISYAVLWIRQGIYKALADEARAVRVPFAEAARIGRVSRARAELAQRYGRDPKPWELAEETGLAEEHTWRLLVLAEPAVGLDAPLSSDGEDSTGIQRVPNRAPGPEEQVKWEMAHQALEAALAQLPAREAFVIRRCYGMDDEPQSMPAIGEALGVSKQRVFQLLSQALTRLGQDLAGWE